MKTKTCILAILFCSAFAKAQVSPYTGGIGSGYKSNLSISTPCTFFWGGNADGASVNISALTICPPFFGGVGDGYAMDSSVCSVVLPVKLVEFYGVKESNQNVLHWKIATGFDVKNFTIEKSTDGTSFIASGIVLGSTNNSHSYLFIDRHPSAEIDFYRLRIEEPNGSITYSSIIPIRRFLADFFLIYPNPSQGLITLYYYSKTVKVSEIKLLKVDGRMELSKQIRLTSGTNYINLDFQNLVSGIYILAVDDRASNLKVIIQK